MTPTRTWKCTRYTMQISYLYESDFPLKIITSANSPQTRRKNKKQSKAEIEYDKHCSENSQINSLLEKRAFLQSQKLTRTTSARRDLTHSQREIKVPFSSLKNSTFLIASEQKMHRKSCRFTKKGASCKFFRNLSSSVSNLKSPRFSRPQSTASLLFARTRSFDNRPTYKGPAFRDLLHRC